MYELSERWRSYCAVLEPDVRLDILDADGKAVTMEPFVDALSEELALFYPDYRKVYDQLEQGLLNS